MENDHPMIEALRKLVAEEKSYPIDAYFFLYQALDKAQNLVGSRRHVSGRELMEGARLLAVELFGPLTLMVFDHWNLTATDDFGRMVFHLVDRELMGKTEDDKLEDFCDVYSFEEAFAPDALIAQVDATSFATYRLDPRKQPGSARANVSQG